MRMKTRHILVVEDNEIAKRIAKVTLTTLGYTVDVTSYGEKALELASQNSYDCIFMDLGLPQMSGLETTQKIRRSEGKLSSVPIVALTASDDPVCQARCIDAGFNHYVLKPLTRQKAEEIVNHLT